MEPDPVPEWDMVVACPALHDEHNDDLDDLYREFGGGELVVCGPTASGSWGVQDFQHELEALEDDHRQSLDERRRNAAVADVLVGGNGTLSRKVTAARKKLMKTKPKATAKAKVEAPKSKSTSEPKKSGKTEGVAVCSIGKELADGIIANMEFTADDTAKKYKSRVFHKAERVAAKLGLSPEAVVATRIYAIRQAAVCWVTAHKG